MWKNLIINYNKMVLSCEQAKRLWITPTLNYREMCLNEEGFYKISDVRKTDITLYWLYAFALVGIFYFTWHLIMLIYSLIK